MASSTSSTPRCASWSRRSSRTTRRRSATWSGRSRRRRARTSSWGDSCGSAWARREALSAKPQRLLLKLCGELLAGEAGHGIADEILAGLAQEVNEVHALGVQVGIVLGEDRSEEH